MGETTGELCRREREAARAFDSLRPEGPRGPAPLRLRPEGHDLDTGWDRRGGSSHDRVANVDHSGAACRLPSPDASFRGSVMVEAGVPVKVVGGEIEPAGDLEAQPVDKAELERRKLRHYHRLLLPRKLLGSRQERVTNVAGDNDVLARALEHGTCELGHRGLTVGPGDPSQRDVRPCGPLGLDLGPGELHLGDDGYPRL